MKGHNFHVIPINQVKKIRKERSFGPNPAPIDTSILSTRNKSMYMLSGL